MKPQPGSNSGTFQEEGGQGQFRRPYTQQKSDQTNAETGDGFDDFETVDDKPFKKTFK